MLARERVRLLREDPWDATALAQEIYAIWQDDQTPLDVGAGITITSPPGTTIPPIQIGTVPPDGLPFISGTSSDGTPFVLNITPSGGVAPPSGGGGSAAASTPAVFVGTVTGGTGSTYTVNLGTRVVSATQLGMPTGQSLPSGTPAIVVQVGGSYYMQAQVAAAFSGTIVSGSGTLYSATLTGIDSPVAVTCVGGDSAVTLPSGMAIIAWRAGDGSYIMQPPTSYAGVVASGSGTSYTITLRNSMGTITATQIQFAGATAIPVGSGVLVLRMPGGSYVMQAPVWL